MRGSRRDSASTTAAVSSGLQSSTTTMQFTKSGMPRSTPAIWAAAVGRNHHGDLHHWHVRDRSHRTPLVSPGGLSRRAVAGGAADFQKVTDARFQFDRLLLPLPQIDPTMLGLRRHRRVDRRLIVQAALGRAADAVEKLAVGVEPDEIEQGIGTVFRRHAEPHAAKTTGNLGVNVMPDPCLAVEDHRILGRRGAVRGQIRPMLERHRGFPLLFRLIECAGQLALFGQLPTPRGVGHYVVNRHCSRRRHQPRFGPEFARDVPPRELARLIIEV